MSHTLIVVLILALVIPFTGCGKSGEPGSKGVEQSNSEKKEAVAPSLQQTSSERKEDQGTDLREMTESEAIACKELEQLDIPWSADSFTSRAKSGDIGAVQLFLDAGMDPEAKDTSGGTAMGNAAYSGHIDIVKLLLDHKADVNTKAKESRTALMDAALGGHTDIVKLLLDHKADVNAKTAGGNTALMNAAYGEHTETVQLLKEAGAME